MKYAGKIYLIPTPLGESPDQGKMVSNLNKEILLEINYYLVENIKTARRHLRTMGFNLPFDDITLMEYSKNQTEIDYAGIKRHLAEGKNIGVLSEAGCPGIADPGSEIVKFAHEENIQICPLIGPNSIILALMGSGLNGQSFCFHGYLPKDQKERNTKLKEIERQIKTNNQTQVFIETPYRNKHLIESMLAILSSEIKLCAAINLTTAHQFIKTKTIGEWRTNIPLADNQPAIFLLGK